MNSGGMKIKIEGKAQKNLGQRNVSQKSKLVS